MKLAELGNKLQSGDVLAFEGTAWTSRVIQQFTRSRFSHVGFAIWTGDTNLAGWYVLEALEHYGVRLQPLPRYLEECERRHVRVHWYTIADPTVDRGRLLGYCVARLGSPYAWRQLVWSFLGRGIRRLLRLRRVTVQAQAFFCSELAAAAFEAAGYVPDLERDPALTAPGDVSEYTCLRRMGTLQP